MGSNFSRVNLDSLLEVLPNPVFVKDEQHRWVLLNDACCRFIGHERSELIGKSDYDFFPKSEADVFWKKDDLAAGFNRHLGKPAAAELIQEIVAEAPARSGHPVSDDGGPAPAHV